VLSVDFTEVAKMTGQSLPAHWSSSKDSTMADKNKNQAWKVTSLSLIAPLGMGR